MTGEREGRDEQGGASDEAHDRILLQKRLGSATTGCGAWDERGPLTGYEPRAGADHPAKGEGLEALVYTAGSPFRPDVKGPGYWVFAPAQLAGGSIVLINRGFVPLERKDPASRADGKPHGIVDVVGVMRWPETRGLFTPADDPKTNVWYLRDSKAIAEAKKWASVAPFYIDQEQPVPPGGAPLPGKLAVQLLDNHLQYAITWFGLALALAGVYVVWLAGRFRRRA